MNTPETRGIGDLTAAELVSLRALLGHCPDCRPHVRIGHLGAPPRFVAMVDHDPTCPAIPDDMRARGHTTMIIYEPLLVTLARQRQEGPDDAT
jgi:hypothetical protein